jgi:hypothetical protein
MSLPPFVPQSTRASAPPALDRPLDLSTPFFPARFQTPLVLSVPPTMASDTTPDTDRDALRSEFEEAYDDAFALKEQLIELSEGGDSSSQRKVAAAFGGALVRRLAESPGTLLICPFLDDPHAYPRPDARHSDQRLEYRRA